MNNQQCQDKIIANLEAVSDDLWQYTRHDLAPPVSLLKRRAGLRARLTKLRRELL